MKFWNSAVYFIFDIVSFDISSNCRHFNGSPLLCPINLCPIISYVFRLQYPRVFHCRIVPIEKLTTLVALGRKKTSRIPFRFKIKNKSFESHAQSSRKLFVEYFHETFVRRHHSNLTKYIVSHCIFMIYDKNNNYLRSFIINHKNTINIIHLWRTNVSRKYSPPLSCVHEKFSRRLHVTFK
jgi:hypothetical protein